MNSAPAAKRPLFIVFEGIDGAGTTTQAQAASAWLEESTQSPVFLTREPSQGPIGALLHQALRRRIAFDPRVMSLLFAADRLDHLYEEMHLHLKDDVSVICDRYYLSSMAYQMVDAPQDLEWIAQLNAKAVSPDLTILIDVPADVAMDRIYKGRLNLDLYEDLERQKQVRQNYLHLADQHQRPDERIEVINGDRAKDQVHCRVRELISSV